MERSQYQYQRITGPVWTEPVAEKLAWLPRAQQPARELPRARLDWSVYPPAQITPPAYDPQTLEWQASARYTGKPLARSIVDWSAYPPPQLAPAGYDPQTLEWQPAARYIGRALPYALVSDAFPYQETAFDPASLDWRAFDRYAGRRLPHALQLRWVSDPLPVVAATFDPATLTWVPRGTAPRVQLERRIRGDFQQPAFDALYKPERLQWITSDRYAGKGLPFARQGQWVTDPTPVVVAFDPRTMDWMPRGMQPRIPVERRSIGALAHPPFIALYNPARMEWVLSGLQPQRRLPAILRGAWVSDPAFFAPAAATAVGVRLVLTGADRSLDVETGDTRLTLTFEERRLDS